MINWKYIVTKLSEKYHSPGYGFWTEEYLRRSWKITFDFPPSRFHDPNDMHGNFATLFDFLATIANLDNVTDQEKIEKMVILLENIADKIDITTINKVLVKGGYDVPLPEALPTGRIIYFLKATLLYIFSISFSLLAALFF